MSNAVAGRRGGKAVLKEYGTSFFREIGAKGGRKTVRRYGRDYMSLLGSLGADATNENLSVNAHNRIVNQVNRILGY